MHIEINPSISGCSGDMLISALLSIIEEDPELMLSDIVRIVNSVVHSNLEAKVEKVGSDGLQGYRLKLEGDSKKILTPDLTKHILELASNLQNDRLILDAYNIILEGELHIHGTEDVHLHELGTVDTLFDLFGVCYLIEHISPDSIDVLPVETGYGTVKTAHGILPVPAPVTQFILEKGRIATVSPKVQGETLTPTGAALLFTLDNHSQNSKSVIWQLDGYGYGTKEFKDRPNALRVRVGQSSPTASKVTILESSLDDISGEHLGHTMNVLLDSGALDVSYSPLFMKKNRPGWLVRVICKDETVERISDLLMKYTGTLGVRVFKQDRHISSRSSKKIIVNDGHEINLKQGKYTSKFEFEDLIKLSKISGLSPLEIERRLMSDNLD